MAVVIGGGSGNTISIAGNVGAATSVITSDGTNSSWKPVGVTTEITFIDTQRSQPSFVPYSSVVTTRLSTSYDIYDISFSPNVASFCGSAGKIEKMTHNASTISAVTNSTGVTNSITSSFYWSNTSKFYFATTSGRILVSDGSSLNSVSLITLPGSAQTVEGFCAANNLLFACQDNGYLCYSSDGVNWTQVRMPTLGTNYVAGVAYESGTYYIASLNSQYFSVYSSTNLSTFTEFRNNFGTNGQSYFSPVRFKDFQYNSLFKRWEGVGGSSFYNQTAVNGSTVKYYYPLTNIFQLSSGETLGSSILGSSSRGYSVPGDCPYGRVFCYDGVIFFDSDGSTATNKSTVTVYLSLHNDPYGLSNINIPLFSNVGMSTPYCCAYNPYTREAFIAGNVSWVSKAKLTSIVNSSH
jgi:hypothetical protein